jgi:hypothetical protein
MSIPKKSAIATLGNSSLLRGVAVVAAASALVVCLSGIAAAAIVVRRPAPHLPVMLTGPYLARPVVWIAPPRLRVVVVPAPRPGWIWSPGYWNWSGAAYVWTDGVWLPARPGFSYVPAHWDRFAGGWRFIPGGWIRRPL